MIVWLVGIIICSAFCFWVGFRVGLARTDARQRKLTQSVMRELEFRDRQRADSYKTRNVTMSGSKNEGRSRVRTAIRKR